MDLTKQMDFFYYKMSVYELRVLNKQDYYGGLSYNSILYLNVICQMGECTLSQLAETLKITKSGATLKVNELMKQGALIKTQSNDDKRVFFVRLSKEMEKTISYYNLVFQNIEKKLKQKYSDAQLALFGEILQNISECEWNELEDEIERTT